MVATHDGPQPPHPKSLLEDKGERYLRNYGIDVAMTQYRKAGIISHLAMLLFGSDKLFDADVQSLGASFVEAFVRSQRTDNEFVAAIAHLQRVDYTNAQGAAILISLLDETRFDELAESLDAQTDIFVPLAEDKVTARSVALTLIHGIGYLLSDEELARVAVMSKVLQEAIATCKKHQST